MRDFTRLLARDRTRGQQFDAMRQRNIAVVAVQENPHISRSSIGFPESSVDESVHAEAVARHVGSHQEAFHFGSGCFVEPFP